MFQFRRFPSYTYLIQYMMYVHTHTDCSIRKSADQFILADPRSLSQLVTSFVGSWCQGIHLMLFLAWTSFVLFSCLSFANNFVTMKKLFRFYVFRLDSFESRLNCSFFTTISWKTFYLTLFLKSQNYLFVFFFIQFPMTFLSSNTIALLGGLKWSRTTDLMLIRHAL